MPRPLQRNRQLARPLVYYRAEDAMPVIVTAKNAASYDLLELA